MTRPSTRFFGENDIFFWRWYGETKSGVIWNIFTIWPGQCRFFFFQFRLRWKNFRRFAETFWELWWSVLMPKKTLNEFLRKKLGRTITFWGVKIGKIFFTKSGQFLLLIKKIKISATFDPPNRRWGAIFNRGAPKNVVFLSFKGFWGYEGVPSNTT